MGKPQHICLEKLKNLREDLDFFHLDDLEQYK